MLKMSMAEEEAISYMLVSLYRNAWSVVYVLYSTPVFTQIYDAYLPSRPSISFYFQENIYVEHV